MYWEASDAWHGHSVYGTMATSTGNDAQAGFAGGAVQESCRAASAATSDLDSAAAEAAAVAEARSLAHSLFSDDEDDDEGNGGFDEYGGRTARCTVGEDTGRSWFTSGAFMDAQADDNGAIGNGASAVLAYEPLRPLISVAEAGVQTDVEQPTDSPGGSGAAAGAGGSGSAAGASGPPAAASPPDMQLVAAARQEIERLKELNAKLMAARGERD